MENLLISTPKIIMYIRSLESWKEELLKQQQTKHKSKNSNHSLHLYNVICWGGGADSR